MNPPGSGRTCSTGCKPRVTLAATKCIALPAEAADKAIAFLNDKGESAWKIGYIKASDSEQRVVIE